MGIICPCCGLRFIVCAAHLTPDGQTVQCLKCATRWAMPAGAKAVPRSRPAVAWLAMPQPVAGPPGG